MQLRNTHIFNLYVKSISLGQEYDLTPIYGTESLYDKAATIQGEDYMVGSMSWIVNKIDNQLNYKVYENSDKALINGKVTLLDESLIKNIYVEIELSPRVSEVVSIGDSIYDIRCDDEVYEKVGITVYNLQNIEEIILNDNNIKFYLIKNLSDSLYLEGNNFEYSFSLFPHVGYNVENYEDITPLFSAPHNYYREYYLTLPGLLANSDYGICPNQHVFPIKAQLGNDSLVVCIEIYCDAGNYPINLYLKNSIVKSVSINGVQFDNWNYDEFTNILVLENNWEEGCYEIKIFNKELDKFCILQNYPNPFGTSTTISFSLNNNQHTKNALIEIYNLKGQLIRRLTIINHQTSIKWNGTDESGKSVSNGIYFYKLINNKKSLTKKMLLMR
ncbi:MAG: T9SS type A sorting domain-containing protein [Candidatus Cloacimonadota bacterium]|nr:T9SS type A sorting domain-containing protein [Candidatus Cloacimonadota bacterium]